MKFLNKKEISQKLGKFSFLSGKGENEILDKVKYLGGISIIDEMIQGVKVKPELLLDISFRMRPYGLELYFIQEFLTFRIGLEGDKINYWGLENQKIIKEKKSKSIVGRALLGGILLGPLGAIVGGMTGIGDKDVFKSINGIDNMFYSILISSALQVLPPHLMTLKKHN